MGGANNQKFGREGDLNSDPADCFFIKANNCSGNIYQINQNKFTIQYGHSFAYDSFFVGTHLQQIQLFRIIPEAMER